MQGGAVIRSAACLAEGYVHCSALDQTWFPCCLLPAAPCRLPLPFCAGQWWSPHLSSSPTAAATRPSPGGTRSSYQTASAGGCRWCWPATPTTRLAVRRPHRRRHLHRYLCRRDPGVRRCQRAHPPTHCRRIGSTSPTCSESWRPHRSRWGDPPLAELAWSRAAVGQLPCFRATHSWLGLAVGTCLTAVLSPSGQGSCCQGGSVGPGLPSGDLALHAHCCIYFTVAYLLPPFAGGG